VGLRVESGWAEESGEAVIERHVNPLDFQGPLGVQRSGVIVVADPQIQVGFVDILHKYPDEWPQAFLDMAALGLRMVPPTEDNPGAET
jgi:hypothetical protein